MWLDLVTVAAFVMASLLVYLIGVLMSRMQRGPAQHRLVGFGTEIASLDLPISGPGVAVRDTEARDKQFQELDLELSRAGWYRANSRERFLGIRNAIVFYALIATAAASFILSIEDFDLGLNTAAIGLVVSGLLWAVPRVYLRASGTQRVMRIRRSIPDALDLTAMCLSGGLPLNRAFQYVSQELASAHPDLATEFSIVLQHAEMRSFEFAFRQFARRIDAPEVVSLSSLITQGQRFGTDIATAIRDYADSTRLHRRQTADERANKASVKLLFPLTLCLLPSVFIILWGPSVLELWIFLRSLQGTN